MCPTIFDPANLELDVIPDQALAALSSNQNPTVWTSFLGKVLQPKNPQDQMHKVCSFVSFKVMFESPGDAWINLLSLHNSIFAYTIQIT